jgi:tetratricopeptide (TPR) repeat protein
MSDRAWETARIDDLDRVPVGEHGLEWRPVRRRFGIRAFGTNVYTSARAGGEIVEPHSEERLGHEEMYVVLRGHATFTLGDEELDAPVGTLVFIRDPSVRRQATAREPDTAVLAVGGKPGEPFEPSAWEATFAAAPLARQGHFDEATAIVRDELERRPDHPMLLFNLACFEALAGRKEEALEHLARAVELDPTMGEYATADSDLDSLRDDPRFPR